MSKITRHIDILDEVCMAVASSYPIYSYFLADLNRRYATEKEKEKIPQATIQKYGSTTMMELVVNKEYLESLPVEQRPMVLMHNILHIVFSHQFLKPIMSDDECRAIATDMAINQLIREDSRISTSGGSKVKLPDGWIEENSFQPLVFPSGLGSVEYYNILKDLKQKKEDEGSSGSAALDAMLDGEGLPQHGDMDEIGEGMSDAEQEFAKQQVENKIKEGIESGSGIGNCSWLKDAFPHLFEVKPSLVNWKQIVRNFIASSISSSQRRTRKRPNKRFDDAPGNTTDYRSKVVFSMDCSGSISDKEFEEFHNELYHMYRTNVEIEVHIWDSALIEEYQYRGKPIVKRVCGGGTDASHSIKRVNEKRRKVDACVILTDGFVPPPIHAFVPTLWVITESGSMDFPHNGKKIRMNDVNK